MFSLSPQPLEGAKLKESLRSPRAGALAIFEGWVRDHNEGKRVSGLLYEAFPELCAKEAEAIFQEVKKKFPILKAKCVHRVGKLAVGDMAVWVGVTSAHRQDAFAACRYIIDNIKMRLPIWKKEYYLNRQSAWVICTECSGSRNDHTHSHTIVRRRIGHTPRQKRNSPAVLKK